VYLCLESRHGLYEMHEGEQSSSARQGKVVGRRLETDASTIHSASLGARQGRAFLNNAVNELLQPRELTDVYTTL
jgi:hypothetical protein